MKFIDATGKTGLVEDVDFLCGGTTSASYPTLDKVRNINAAYHDVARLIWDSDGTWQYDDSNNTDLPKATRTMANASADYLVPTTAIRIEGVEVKDASSVWHKLKPIDYSDIEGSPEEYYKTAGLSRYYDLEGNSIRLFPPPASGDVTLTSGLCIRLSRNVSEFTSASTTSPGFPVAFHRILSVAASLDFEKDPQQRTLLIHMKDRLEKGLVKFYSKRATEMKTRIKPYRKKRWREYL